MVKVAFSGGGGSRENSTAKLLLGSVATSSCTGLESLRFFTTTSTGLKPKKNWRTPYNKLVYSEKAI